LLLMVGLYAIKSFPILFQRLWQGWKQRLLTRSQSPWLAGLVIVLQQSALVERWLAGSQPKLEFIGAGCLLAVLVWLRRHVPLHRLHVFSQIALASSLFILLAAEWT